MSRVVALASSLIFGAASCATPTTGSTPPDSPEETARVPLAITVDDLPVSGRTVGA